MALHARALTTVADFKAYHGISVTTYDTMLEAFINGVSLWIEKYCGRQFFDDGATNINEYFDGGDRHENEDIRRLFLKNFPVNSLVSVDLMTGTDNANPTWTPYSAVYDYVNKSERGEIAFNSSLPSGDRNIRVVYQGGYTDLVASVPDVVLAANKLVAKEFDKRKAQGVQNEAIGGGSISWERNMDTYLRALLDPYKNLHLAF